MKAIKIVILLVGALFTSCDEAYLDVVPDNLAEIDDAFANEANAKKFLYTCYSYIPNHSNPASNPAIIGSDEIWVRIATGYYGDTYPRDIVMGLQNTNNPLNDYWNGALGGKKLFQAIRDCNIFLENVEKVKDIEEYELRRWMAEVKVLKAYFHFYLLRMYGPIPVVKENLPVDAAPDVVKVYRAPAEDVFTYIVSLVDEAVPFLPIEIQLRGTELGRITALAAKAIKADALMLQASPLFNGSANVFNLIDGQGRNLLSSDVDKNKWKLAMEACNSVIKMAESVNVALYEQDTVGSVLEPEIDARLSIRESVSSKWNDELIWGNSTAGTRNLQAESMARLSTDHATQESIRSNHAPTLKMAELFYSKNGVPIDEDVNFDYDKRYDIQAGDEAHKFHIEQGYETVKMHFDREIRFYASLGFDGGKWYGSGRTRSDNQWTVKARRGGHSAQTSANLYSSTGYWPKKLVNLETEATSNSFNVENYPFPIYRLAEFYLSYAEARNEYLDAPDDSVFVYIDKVRQRAGLKGVKTSWQNFSSQPTKPTTQSGVRDIIHQERSIELAFEGKRLWDLRRWMRSQEEMNLPIAGWNIRGKEPAEFYTKTILFRPSFSPKDYFWPIKVENLTKNSHLIQNFGW
jgi:hypothetical protein